MRLDRLQTLADNAETWDPEQIDMGCWENQCGTVHCVFGRACYIPEFQEAGLYMEHEEGASTGQPAFGHHRAFDAAAAFFEISRPQAQYLFHCSSYGIDVKLSDVIRRLRRFISRHGGADTRRTAKVLLRGARRREENVECSRV